MIEKISQGLGVICSIILSFWYLLKDDELKGIFFLIVVLILIVMIGINKITDILIIKKGDK